MGRLYQIADHLGSIRVIKDGTGDVLQRFDYYPFGGESRVWATEAVPEGGLRRICPGSPYPALASKGTPK